MSLAVTSMSADFPSGKVPTAHVRLRTSRFSRSMALLVRMMWLMWLMWQHLLEQIYERIRPASLNSTGLM